MYSTDGAFGKVRFSHFVPSSDCNSFLFPTVCGWHRCNDLYSINRYGNGFNKYLILITISGAGCMTINHTEYKLPAGTVALLPKNTDISYCTPKGGLWEFYWLHPSNSCDFLLDAVAKKGNYVSKFDASHNYTARVETIIKLINDNSLENAIEISMEMSAILHYCAMDLTEKNIPTSIAQRACSYITRNFKENISINSLAEDLYVSTAHLIRTFKDEFGYTPHQYLIDYRLSYSLELLKFSNMQIDEIAAAVGFSSSSHYISTFRQRYGCTPGQYV